jgi:hypothetical protein
MATSGGITALLPRIFLLGEVKIISSLLFEEMKVYATVNGGL